MKKVIYSLAITTAALTMTSCSESLDLINDIIDPSNKEMISFSLSDEANTTRAGFTGSATSLAMRIQSDEKSGSGVKYTRTVATAEKDGTNTTVSYSTVSFADAYKRYWDDAFGRKALLSVYAVAVPNASSSLTNNSKTLEELLSKGDENNTWGTTATNTIVWKVTTDEQQKDADGATSPSKNIDKEDLVYSNNIQADATLGKDGVYRWNYTSEKYLPEATGKEGDHKDGRMLFFQESMTDATAATTAATDGAGHFDKGHLKFKHALSRMTIQLVAGEGYASPAPFAFATSTNIKLLGMNVSGTLDVKTGSWTNVQPGAINKIAKITSETNAAGTYVAQMLPGYTFGKTSDTNVMQFTIDNNTYYITQKMLFDALVYDADGDGVKDTGDGDLIDKKNESGITMEQGKNYKFKITINKKQIEKITATLAAWVDVNAAEESMNNSHVEFTFLSPTGTNCTQFQFYRLKQDLGSIITNGTYSAENYSGDYKTEGAATIETMTGTNAGKYQATGWYFDDNKTAYHFRTLNPLAADEGGTNDDKSENIANTSDPVKSYFTMKADATTKDYHWGAPMATEKNLAYSTTEGFKGNLHKGLTSTDSDIKITELHMMSNLNIVLKTSTGSDKVNLEGATVTLTKLSTKATVDMGTGLITQLAPESPTTWATATQATTAPTTYWATDHDSNKDQTNAFTCAVIPQNLKRGTGDDDYIGITITTSDNNQYYVVKRLSEILATSVTADERNQQKDQPITYWYPNHNYTYTFKITKNQIDCITATVANWVDVTAAEKDINLED